MKLFLAFLSGLLVTVLFYELCPRPVPEKTKSDFQSLAVNEAQKFAAATSPDEKLRAAEELYGRMMILFLANLGLELRKSSPVSLELPDQDGAPETGSSGSSLSAVAPTCPPCAQAKAPDAGKKEDKKLSPTEKFQSSPYFNRLDPIVKKMQGVFSGKLTYFAGSRRGKIDSALIEVELAMQEDRLDGGIAVILADENNVPYSRNRGKGGNKTIRYHEKEKIVYVEASPNSFFAFRAREFDGQEVRGEYYEDNAMVGRALLFRQ